LTMVLIVGYGNITREDDGAGLRLAEEIERRKLPGVEVRAAQQMHLELLEDAAAFDRILLLDATRKEMPLEIRPVTENAGASLPSSHTLDPSVLMGLWRSLYGEKLSLYVLAIPGERFDFGVEMSPRAAANVEKGRELVLRFIKESEPKEASHA
jgi:hydrogenase maturation protease